MYFFSSLFIMNFEMMNFLLLLLLYKIKTKNTETASLHTVEMTIQHYLHYSHYHKQIQLHG